MNAAKRRKIAPDVPKKKKAEAKEVPPNAASEPSSDEQSEEESTTLEEPSAEEAAADAPKKTFKDLGVVDALCEACEALNYKHPTPIQEKSIPVALEGRDIIGLAETGSGKTAAFALPVLQALLDKPQPLFGLVLAPDSRIGDPDRPGL
ncbi:hypothetical protein NM208_g3947 [Fusarium decemcellulare]|uniref:Uncharacterized protein n=1 Tax=Fusarium decemcellulare TaxID=57161 RepID=A0ACC1SMQ0_9HYPO|nr:hypothetical protein NM208_g3947 [Fusarium decemcellulare]